MRIGQALRAEKRLVGTFFEIPARAACTRDLPDLAVDQVSPCTQAVFFTPRDKHIAVDEAAKNIVEAVACQQGLDGRIRIFLPYPAQRFACRVIECGGGDFLVTDNCNTITTCNAAESARAGDVHTGEGEAD